MGQKYREVVYKKSGLITSFSHLRVGSEFGLECYRKSKILRGFYLRIRVECTKRTINIHHANMRRIIPQTLLVSVVLAPLFLIGGAAFTSKSSPIEGRILSDVDFLKDSENHFEVVFFGYVGCSYICPTSLLTLAEVLDELKKEDLELSLGGFFVDVNAETQIARAEEYGLYFSSNIKGVNTNQEKLDHLRKQFGLNVYDTNKEVDLPA